jgi:hypothetical protein
MRQRLRTLLIAFPAVLVLQLNLLPPACQAITPPADGEAEDVLKRFLFALAEGETQRAYDLVAPTTKESGDPVAYRAKADFRSFAAEAKAQSREKFENYELGRRREEGKDRVRIFVHFTGGDNDETMLVREDGRWYVADPIHIIR